MDAEKIYKIKEMLEDIIGEDGVNMPSDKELDYDDNAVDMYAAMHRLLIAINEFGL